MKRYHMLKVMMRHFTLTHEKMFWIQACCTLWTWMRKENNCVLHRSVDFFTSLWTKRKEKLII